MTDFAVNLAAELEKANTIELCLKLLWNP